MHAGDKRCPGFLRQDTIAGFLTTDEVGKPAWHQLWMGGEPHKEATKRAPGEDSLKFYLQVSGHTSCGRTSGRVCYTPQPAVEALCPHSSHRWTPPGGFDWDTVWHVRGNGGGPALPLQDEREGRGLTE